MKHFKLLLLALYSPKYPAIGETHGISATAGAVLAAFDKNSGEIKVVDMVGLRGDRLGQAIEVVSRFQPNIIGISTTYGSYDVLTEMYPLLMRTVKEEPLVILGGVLATYIPEVLLRNIAPTALVVCGEGEEAILDILGVWRDGGNRDTITNLVRMDHEVVLRNSRRLVNVGRLPVPYRDHIGTIASNGAQIFAEASRGCSWAACTFCLRGLTDVEGRGREYRRFAMERVHADLSRLYSMGIRSVTFADEDFLGGATRDIECFVDEFCNMALTLPGMQYDVSMTVHSVCDAHWSPDQLAIRHKSLERLKYAGLRKVFLGIESGSPQQLRRYAKGHTLTESATACDMVQNIGLTLELGFIMFDPLCSLSEILQNIAYLRDHNLAGAVSFVCNEMRLQVDSRYRDMLEKIEKQQHEQLYDRRLDYNTLSYVSSYRDVKVGALLSVLQTWNARFRQLHYPLKSLSRYGQGGALRQLHGVVVTFVSTMRVEFLEIFERAVRDCIAAGRVLPETEAEFSRRMKLWGTSVRHLFDRRGSHVDASEIIISLLSAAEMAESGKL